MELKAENVNSSSIAQAVEIPSGKDQPYENFPVGSWLLPAHLRPHVATFYEFARAIDDIADSNTIEAREKFDRLSGFENALLGKESILPGFSKAYTMRQSLIQTGVSNQHCLDLIRAFKQDTTKLRYENWGELIEYCQMSAAPVGRYLLDLHGESSREYIASDALCNVLQVLNHLQDCKEDYLNLNRVYLPLVWMRENGVSIQSLGASYSVPELKSVFLKMLDTAADLLDVADMLPRRLASKRLAMESQAIINIANILERELRGRDPLAERVKLSKWQYVFSFATGALTALFAN